MSASGADLAPEDLLRFWSGSGSHASVKRGLGRTLSAQGFLGG